MRSRVEFSCLSHLPPNLTLMELSALYMCPQTWPTWFTAHLTCWDKAVSVMGCYTYADYINKRFIASFIWLSIDECLYRWPISRSSYRRHNAPVQQNPLWLADILCVTMLDMWYHFRTANVVFFWMLLNLDSTTARNSMQKADTGMHRPT